MTPARRRPLRIFMNADTIGGVFTYAVDLAQSLARDGDHVLLATMGPPMSPGQRAALTGVERLDVVETGLALEWQDPEGRDVDRARKTLRALAHDMDADIVHLNSFREALAGFDAPVLVMAHSSVGTWFRACRGDAPDARWSGYVRDVRAALDAADAWAAPSRAFRDEILRVYRPARPGHVAYNGLNLPQPGATGASRILAAGRMWDEAKGLATVAAATIPAGWTLDIVGPVRAQDALASRAAVLGAMRRSSVFVSAAIYEPFGLTALEAAASGCALLLSDIPTFREVWGADALYFRPRDPACLSAQLERLCTAADLRRDMRARAAQRARLYSAAACAARARDLYGRLSTAERRTSPAESAA